MHRMDPPVKKKKKKDTGEAVAFGRRLDGQCAVPALAAGERYEDPLLSQQLRCRVALVVRRTDDSRLDALVSAVAVAMFEETVLRCLEP